MKITNHLDLPQTLVDAVMRDEYTKGDADYSVTGLLKPPRITELERRHWDDIEVDVADMLFSLYGRLMHALLEKAETTAIAEQRLFARIGNVRISGAIDRMVINQRLIQDWKFVSLYKFKDGCPDDFKAQLNSYRWLVGTAARMDITRLEIIALYRDHKKGMAIRDEFYPLRPVAKFVVEPWPMERIELHLRERIRMHEEAKKSLPLCTDEDRWNDGPTFAVQTPGAKRAKKLYDNQAEALKHVEASPVPLEIVKREGIDKRCEHYCLVSRFCTQYQGKLNGRREAVG